MYRKIQKSEKTTKESTKNRNLEKKLLAENLQVKN